MNRSDINRRNLIGLGLASLATPWTATFAAAQAKYPDRPIRVIVPRAAGGVIDIVARQWAEKVTPLLGTIVIENQGGGGGTIGTAAVAHARPDGYTLLMGSTSDLVLNPVISNNSLYNPERDFVSIRGMAVSVAAILVNAALPVRTLQDFVAYAKANPGKLSYGSAGAGTMSNLAGELFKKLADLPDIVHVPYKGAGAGYADLISGQIPMMASNISNEVLELHKAGKIRILAVTTERRLVGAPDIPTAAEEGFPGLIAQLFIGLFAPAQTSSAIIAQVDEATRKVMIDKDMQNKLLEAGFEPVIDSGPDKTARYIKDELVRWTPILKEAGLKN